MRWLIVALAFALLAFQSPPAPVTVESCLLRSGYSRAVPVTALTQLAGVEAWAGGEGETVLREGVTVGHAFIEDSYGRTRMVSFHVFAGNVFAFVYVHPDDPRRRLPGEPAGVWHGDCLIRVTRTGVGA